MTFEDYKAQILARYAHTRLGRDSDFLEHPSPARLKDYCLLLLERGMSPADKEVFVKFFGGEEENLFRRIESFDIDKLRPVRNFLMGKSDLTRPPAANLAAIVADFEIRPFARFRNWNGEIVAEVPTPPNTQSITDHAPGKGRKRKVLLVALALVLMLGIGGFGSARYLMRPQCMQWVNNGYVAVDCDNEFAPADIVQPLDPGKLSGMKRIVPCDTTVFFRNGKPVVWYDKYRKKVEFFTMPGLHPESGRTLKPVTPYMINKYVTAGK